VSLETQTPTTGTKITVLLRTLTHVRYHLHKKRKKNRGILIFQALQNGTKWKKKKNNWYFYCFAFNLQVSREKVVSLEAQTPTTGAKITVLLRTLTHVKYHLHKKKKQGYFNFSSSTKWYKIKKTKNNWYFYCFAFNLQISREKVVSLETQTPTTGTKITVLLRTLTHVRYHLHKKRKKNRGILIFQALQNGTKWKKKKNNWYFYCFAFNLQVSREKVVSLEAQTPTTGAKITVLLRTLTHVKHNLHKKRKKQGYFNFSSSTKWYKMKKNKKNNWYYSKVWESFYLLPETSRTWSSWQLPSWSGR